MYRSDPRVGLRRHRRGWQAYVQVAGRLYTRSFPLDTTSAEMQAWRHSKRAEVRAMCPTEADPMRPLTDGQKAAVLEMLQQAIRRQATSGGSVLEHVRRALGFRHSDSA